MARRVYFAFHYQDVIDFRVNVVRQHNKLIGAQTAGYYDHSIWEESRRTSPLALKRLVNRELQGSSVTVVLIGSETWQRPWVRYEIVKSLEQGNHVVGVHINSIKGKDTQTKKVGTNPFQHMGLEVSSAGTRATPTEFDGRKWVYYGDLGPFSIATQPLPNRGRHWPLSKWLKCYDWVADQGFKNFSSWIEP